jgi:hypothetical protein
MLISSAQCAVHHDQVSHDVSAPIMRSSKKEDQLGCRDGPHTWDVLIDVRLMYQALQALAGQTWRSFTV